MSMFIVPVPSIVCSMHIGCKHVHSQSLIADFHSTQQEPTWILCSASRSLEFNTCRLILRLPPRLLPPQRASSKPVAPAHWYLLDLDRYLRPFLDCLGASRHPARCACITMYVGRLADATSTNSASPRQVYASACQHTDFFRVSYCNKAIALGLPFQ
jgi:hypothetical protein